MDWIGIIGAVGGFVGAGGLMIFGVRYYVRKMRSEADKVEAEANTKEWELEEQRIKSLYDALKKNDETTNKLLETIDSLTQRLSTLNATVDRHIDRNRELSDRLYTSEQEINRLNVKLIEAIEERDFQQRRADYLDQWKCLHNVCGDPRGRKPENEKLKTMVFVEPQRKAKAAKATKSKSEGVSVRDKCV